MTHSYAADHYVVAATCLGALCGRRQQAEENHQGKRRHSARALRAACNPLVGRPATHHTKTTAERPPKNRLGGKRTYPKATAHGSQAK
jgi:hypothetical protein